MSSGSVFDLIRGGERRCQCVKTLWLAFSNFSDAEKRDMIDKFEFCPNHQELKDDLQKKNIAS